MPYVDPNTVHVPATGAVAPAAWGTVLRDNFEFLIEPPICVVAGSGAQSLTSGAFVAMAAGVELNDTDAMHSTVTNNSRITIQTGGLYLCTAGLAFAAGVGTLRNGFFRLDGVTNSPTSQQVPPVSGNATGMTLVSVFELNAGQYVETMARHNHGSNIDVTLTEFTVMFLARAS